jgi:uncharacterized membrane-anchored protein YitT (DUF2179 family)
MTLSTTGKQFGNEEWVLLNKKIIKEYGVITVGTAIIAAAVYFFMIPGNLTPGSAAAVALLLSNVIPLPVSMITLGLNLSLLVIGILLIGPEFGAKTIYTSILMPVIMRVYEVAFPNMVSINQDPLLDMLCYAVVVSIGLAIVFNCNASSGGLDIVAKLMNKYLRMELGKAMSFSGMAVCVAALVFYDLKTVIISILGTYFSGMVVDYIIFGMNIKRKVCILSAKHEQILNYILHDLHSGASLYEATGAYDKSIRTEIITIVDKQEYAKLMDFLHKTDPRAFITVYSVNEVSYVPKK